MLLAVAFGAVQLLFSNTKEGCTYLRTNEYSNYRGTLPKVASYRDLLEVTAADPLSAMFIAKKRCTTLEMNKIVDSVPTAMDVGTFEIQNIISSGDPENRIDVVFMGDGYTKDERSKFFSDINRLVDEMWNGETFKPVLPMFNIWALFIPSKDSGITYMQYKKDTVFGLTRDGNELRGIMPNKAFIARQICAKLGAKCDYPSIIGNDPFYGGLGGEFVISTASPKTGTVEGEEYDDGYVYSGYNSAKNINSIPWSRWADSPITSEDKLNMLATEHPWAALDKPFTLQFSTSSTYKYWKVLVSFSGVEDASAVELTIDGKALTFDSRGTLDRQFYFWKFDNPLPNGQHTLQVKQLKQPTLKDPRSGSLMGRMICSLDIHEYQNNVFAQFGKVGAFPTWDIRGSKSYRPTNDFCIMRNMTSPRFCPVCVEGMHLNFLQKIRLIDGVDIKCVGKFGLASVKAIPYGQFNKTRQRNSHYDIKWTVDGRELVQFRDQIIATNLTSGSYEVALELNTPHVRVDTKYLSDKNLFKIAC